MFLCRTLKSRRTPLRTLTVVLCLGLLLSSAVYAEALRLPKIFADHGVLQQKSPIPVWGWGEAGSKVSVRLGEQETTTTIGDEGTWRLDLKPVDAGGPYELTVISGKESITLKDILIGEVWLGSGQSNMQWSIKRSENWEAEVEQCANDNIRIAMVFREHSSLPLDELRGLTPWAPCTKESMLDCYNGEGFSAVSYYFAKHLQAELGVPVGIINTSWGGTSIEPWTPPEGFDQVPALNDISKMIERNTSDSPVYQKALKRAIKSVEEWIPEAKSALEAGTFSPALPKVASASEIKNHQSPTALYNAMVNPLVPYANRGFIWYQGESNRGEGMAYRDKMEALIKGWRAKWDDDALACYFVQLAPFNYKNDPQALPEIWEAQSAAQDLPNTGMAVINDIGDVKDIHPMNKRDVGIRLALHALNKTYGREDVVCESPRYAKHEVKDGALTIHFDHAEGLQTRDGEAPTWFEVAGPDGVYHDAVAKIVGTTVVLTSEEVSNPVAMRFAWDHMAEPNLMNGAGLPASAFRAGEVPLEGALRHHVPEADEFEVLYALDPVNAAIERNRVKYDVDNSDALLGKQVERVSYFMHLQSANEKTRWIYTEMDPFTENLAHLGVPAPNKKVWFQQDVDNLFVKASTRTLPQGKRKHGAIEFCGSNYATNTSRKLPGASNDQYDFDDTFHLANTPGYGCMQVHDVESGTTLLAYNNQRAGREADVGIGNNSNGNPDWTFSKSAGKWEQGTLFVLVKTQ